MDRYKDLTAIEVLKMINDSKKHYDEKKEEAIKILDTMDVLDKQLAELTKIMEGLEVEYVELMEVLIEKQNNE